MDFTHNAFYKCSRFPLVRWGSEVHPLFTQKIQSFQPSSTLAFPLLFTHKTTQQYMRDELRYSPDSNPSSPLKRTSPEPAERQVVSVRPSHIQRVEKTGENDESYGGFYNRAPFGERDGYAHSSLNICARDSVQLLNH